MAQTYSQLQAQISKLQAEAEKLHRAERADVIAKIKVAIPAYGITPEDLFGGKSKQPAASKSMAATKSNSKGRQTPKFEDGKGNAWVGRGPRPQWLREALAAGQSLADFAVAADTPAPKATQKIAGPAKPKLTRSKVAAKYKDDSGNSWSGRGSQPNWLKQAIAAGKTLDQLLV